MIEHRALKTIGMFAAFVSLLGLRTQTAYRAQFPLPDMTVPNGLGVNIHIIVPRDNSIEMLAKAGFRWIRMDLAWEQVEHERGLYDFSGYDKLMSQLYRHGLRAIFILDYGNKLYQEGAPRSSDARAAFVRFAHATLQHYRHAGVVWEMYNEPNIRFWKPEPNVNEYIQLAKDVGREVRENEPDEWYIGPGVAGMDMKFLDACLDGGLLDYWDAVSAHPYRPKAPETVAADYERLESDIADHSAGKHVPIICSEWGYTDLAVGQEVQSQYVVREYLTNLSHGIPITIWYDWSDDALDKRNPGEAHFGIVSNDLSPKPALASVQALVRELSGWKLSRKLNDDGSFKALEFKKGSHGKIVAWATGTTARASIDIPSGKHHLTVLGGDISTIRVEGGVIQLELRPVPLVISKS